MSEPWCIFIDIEGFRLLLGQNEVQALRSLGELMRSIFRIGRGCYPEPPDRLFAYQFGDGFIIASEYHEDTLDRCVAMAVAVMRHVAASGCYARAAIAEGALADIQGCYPEEVMSQSRDGHVVMLDAGIMTVTPVMGTALTHSVGLAQEGKPASSGPLLIMGADNCSRLDPSTPQTRIPETALVSIDWVHMESELLASVQRTAGLASPSAAKLETTLADYCASNRVTPQWRLNVQRLLGVPEKDVPA